MGGGGGTNKTVCCQNFHSEILIFRKEKRCNTEIHKTLRWLCCLLGSAVEFSSDSPFSLPVCCPLSPLSGSWPWEGSPASPATPASTTHLLTEPPDCLPLTYTCVETWSAHPAAAGLSVTPREPPVRQHLCRPYFVGLTPFVELFQVNDCYSSLIHSSIWIKNQPGWN